MDDQCDTWFYHAYETINGVEENKPGTSAYYVMEDHAKIWVRRAWAVQQARIDALMIEYCPAEMTMAQMATWASCQQKGDIPTQEERIAAAIRNGYANANRRRQDPE